MELLTKVFIPFCTFFLGIIFTLALKRYEQRKALIRQHTEEVSKYINEWYNQLHSLHGDLRGKMATEEADARIYLYVSNRLILPKLLLSVGVLKRYKASKVLIEDVEEFLRLVTTYRPDEPDDLVQCVFVKPSFVQGLGRINNRRRGEGKILEELLPQLDSHLQRINNKAAKLLAG